VPPSPENAKGWDPRTGRGNGLRRSELASGPDACAGDPYDVETMFTGMTIVVDPRLTGPVGEPGSGDLVRFGAGDILSFSATGTCTAGTLFLRSASGTRYAVAHQQRHDPHPRAALRGGSQGVGSGVTRQQGANRPRRARRGRTRRRARAGGARPSRPRPAPSKSCWPTRKERRGGRETCVGALVVRRPGGQGGGDLPRCVLK
jgi:hypothetical protein